MDSQLIHLTLQPLFLQVQAVFYLADHIVIKLIFGAKLVQFGPLLLNNG